MIDAVLPTYNRAPLAFERGEGAWAITADGTRYLDLGAGIAVNALGHANPDLVAARTAQAGRIWHVSNLYQIPEQQRLECAIVDAPLDYDDPDGPTTTVTCARGMATVTSTSAGTCSVAVR